MDITFFEIHLDGAQFGPKTIGEGMMSEEMRGKRMRDRMTKGRTMHEEQAAGEADEGESSGRSRSPPRFAPLVAIVGIAVGYVAYRRFRGGGGEETMDIDAEPVEIEA